MSSHIFIGGIGRRSHLGSRKEYYMHDEFVEEYTVSLSGEKVTIKTRNSNGDGHIATFENVLTHMFNCVIGGSQLLEINENSIECFMEENRAILAEKRDFCWPIDYQTEDELRLFLEKMVTNTMWYTLRMD